MARTKGARGKKNIPSSEEFNTSLKNLSLELLRKMDVAVRENKATLQDTVRIANLIIPLADQLMNSDGGGEPKTPTQSTEEPKKAELFSLTAVKK